MLLIPLYLAIILDQHLSASLRPPKKYDPRFHPAPTVTYGFILGTGVALSVAKDIWL
jgi:hypothetical protein